MLSTAGCPAAALIPNGLLLSGGIDAPQALSTAHCAMVIGGRHAPLQARGDRGLHHVVRHLAEPPDRVGRGGSINGRAASA